MKRVCLITAAVFSCCLHGQDTLNQVDANGRKHGYHIQYADSLGQPVKMENAVMMVLEYYDHGHGNIRSVRERWRRSYPYKLSPQAPLSPTTLFTGRISWYDENSGRVVAEELYVNGFMTRQVGYRKSSITRDTAWYFWEVIDTGKRYQGQAGTYLFTTYPTAYYREARHFWYRRGKKGWRLYPAENNEVAP